MAVVPHVPERIRTCPPIPQSSTYLTEEERQSEVAAYVTDLHRVAVTCRTRLLAVDQILDAAEKNAAN
ncbi:hypothetical protein RPALISO_77 [Ruegeria phage RpAliso]|nr:hypothetical protein RPALISO_77 [Ruegeria phage RpAliso]